MTLREEAEKLRAEDKRKSKITRIRRLLEEIEEYEDLIKLRKKIIVELEK